MNNSYLKDVPNNNEWLAQRELQWLGQKDNKKLSPSEIQGLKHRLFHFHDDPQGEIEAYRKYFFEGNVEDFIKKSGRVKVDDIIFFSPVQTFEAMQYVISEAVTWFLKHPEKANSDNDKQLTVDEHLTATFHSILSPPNGQYFPDELALNLFGWLYGNKFERDRKVELIRGESQYVFNFMIDVENTSLNLLTGIRHYIWGSKSRGDNTRFIALIDYFLSIYPQLNTICFSKVIPPRSSFGVGDKITRSHYTHPRWLIASLHGIVTEFDLDDDFEPLDSLIVNDQEALAKLKNGMAKIKMPDEYYELEKFVLEHGEDCIYA